MRVGIDALTVERSGARLVHEVTMEARSGTVVGLVGPNGSGKSTLLRCVYRADRPSSGVVRLDGADLGSIPEKQGARLVAALPQESGSEFDFSVEEIVAMGRIPHQRSVARTSAEDERLCALALERVGAAALRRRSFLTLSGGEKQRVLIARALAQRPRVLVLDEPTNHLDVAQQLEVLHLVRHWSDGNDGDRAAGPDAAEGTSEGAGGGDADGDRAGHGRPTVLAALHDLNLALRYCDELYVISAGRIAAHGPPAEVLDAELLAGVFGVRAHRVTHPASGAVQLLFDRLPSRAAAPAASLPTAAGPVPASENPLRSL
ncbi:ABC transporter ATP-binding protein [Streptomyces sp. XM4193]|uniref:ABC transporter ATP-binding protein n=1 Tax=Streptomyces sp. XM4193 TaxID=2929782 RepID=UPI001FFB17AF|nr:ABC transporter ATP-binding protein [Streptomyces sp. XM4193]MCK1798190.1 ABC transporter ATP-binding protein [Streptomyces sp. XM4193]